MKKLDKNPYYNIYDLSPKDSFVFTYMFQEQRRKFYNNVL